MNVEGNVHLNAIYILLFSNLLWFVLASYWMFKAKGNVVFKTTRWGKIKIELWRHYPTLYIEDEEYFGEWKKGGP